MPIIQVNMMEGRSVQQKRAMVAAVTRAVGDTLGADPNTVRIIINELIPEHYAVAGLTWGEKRAGAPLMSTDQPGIEA